MDTEDEVRELLERWAVAVAEMDRERLRPPCRPTRRPTSGSG